MENMPEEKSPSKVMSIAIPLVVALIAFAGGWYAHGMSGKKFATPYQAVLLTNGQVYYGRLEGMGTSLPTLHEVYYVQSTVDPQTRQANNILLKRGTEWHAPDQMVLNASHILLVEPVGPNSRVAQLIADLRR